MAENDSLPFDQNEFNGSEGHENTLVAQPGVAASQSTELIVVTSGQPQAPANDAMTIDNQVGADDRVLAKSIVEQSLSNLINAQRIQWASNRIKQEIQGIIKHKGPDGKEYFLKVSDDIKRKWLDDLKSVSVQALDVWAKEQKFLDDANMADVRKSFWTDTASQFAAVSLPVGTVAKILNKDKKQVATFTAKGSSGVDGGVGVGPVAWIILGTVALVSLGLTATAIAAAKAHADQAVANKKANENAGEIASAVAKVVDAVVAGKITPEQGKELIKQTQKTEVAPGSDKKETPKWVPWALGGGLLAASMVVAYLGRDKIKSKVKSVSRSMIQQAANTAMDRVSEF